MLTSPHRTFIQARYGLTTDTIQSAELWSADDKEARRLLGFSAGSGKDRAEITGPGGGPLQVASLDLNRALDRLSDDELRAFIARNPKQAVRGERVCQNPSRQGCPTSVKFRGLPLRIQTCRKELVLKQLPMAHGRQASEGAKRSASATAPEGRHKRCPQPGAMHPTRRRPACGGTLGPQRSPPRGCPCNQ